MRKQALLQPFLLFFLSLLLLPSEAQETHLLPFDYRHTAGSPLIGILGNTLYFVRDGHPQNRGMDNQADLWVAYRQSEGGWAQPVNVGAPVNTREAEQLAGLSASGQRLFIHRPSSGALLAYKRKGRFWEEPQPQRVDSLHLYRKDAFFHFSQNGRVLLSLLGKPGDSGPKDLYVSFLKDENHWSAPQPLGIELPPTAQKASPFLAADQKTLYFASDFPGGRGGFDLYYSRRLDDTWRSWSPPQALGSQVNSPADELFLSLPAQGQTAYFCRRSKAEGGKLFQMQLNDSNRPEKVMLVQGRIKVPGGKQKTAATIRLEKPQGGRAIDLTTTDAEGRYQAILPPDASGSLIADLPGYFPISQPLPLTEREPQDIDTKYALASLSQNAAYQERDAEIQELQLYLRQLDEEMIELQRKREAARARLQQRQGTADISDPEIEALRHKYNYFLLESERMQADTAVLPEDGYDEQAAQERELEDMKARFQRYYLEEKSEQMAEEAMEDGPRHIWEEAPTFEALKAEAKRELEQEMRLEAARERSTKLEPEGSIDSLYLLSEEERAKLQLKTAQLRDQIAAGLEQPRQYQAEEATAKNPYAKEPLWERELRAGLKDAMREEVKQSVQSESEQELQEFAERDLAYRSARLKRQAVREKLRAKMEQQIQMEKQYLNNDTEDIVAPLVPAEQPPPAAQNQVNEDLLLVPPELGQSIPLNNLIFEANKDLLLPRAYPELQRVLTFLRDNPSFIVEIGAHVQGPISHSTALQLTEDRASAVANFLIGNGLERSRIQSRGYGKAFPGQPVDGAGSSQRIELRIIGKR